MRAWKRKRWREWKHGKGVPWALGMKRRDSYKRKTQGGEWRGYFCRREERACRWGESGERTGKGASRDGIHTGERSGGEVNLIRMEETSRRGQIDGGGNPGPGEEFRSFSPARRTHKISAARRLWRRLIKRSAAETLRVQVLARNATEPATRVIWYSPSEFNSLIDKIQYIGCFFFNCVQIRSQKLFNGF